MNYMVHVSSTMWRIKNRPSNSTSCSVTMPYACWFLWQAYYIEDFKWHLHFQFGVVFWKVVLREVYFEGPNCTWRTLKTSILNMDSLPSILNTYLFQSHHAYGVYLYIKTNELALHELWGFKMMYQDVLSGGALYIMLRTTCVHDPS